MRRVDQLLSALGYCSRKEAGAWCAAGRVTLGGAEVRDASRRVDAAQLLVDGAPLEFPDGLFVAFHKPVGLVCSHDAADGPRVYDALPARWLRREPKVTTVGRLDKETSGLLLLTDVGALVQRLTSPRRHVEKTYVATLDGDVPEAAVRAFAEGVPLREGATVEPCRPARLEPLGPRQARVTLDEGRYHQVRRMFAACGLTVTALERTRVGEWTLEGLAPGAWRALPLP